MPFSKFIYLTSLFLILFFTDCGNNAQPEKKLPGLDTLSFYPAFSTDTLEFRYSHVFDSIWKKFVPVSGQSSTVQGELVRAIEKLDHEIRGNGKANWEDPQFKIITTYLKDTLTALEGLPDKAREEIVSDIDILADDESAVTEEFYYDRIRRRIVEWCMRHPTPVKHSFRPDLYR